MAKKSQKKNQVKTQSQAQQKAQPKAQSQAQAKSQAKSQPKQQPAKPAKQQPAKPAKSPKQQSRSLGRSLLMSTSEHVAFALLLAWCALPLLVAASAIAFGLSSPETLAWEGAGVSDQFFLLQSTFRTMFAVLGAFTVIFAVYQVVCSWRTVASVRALRTQPWFYFLAALLAWSVICSLVADNPLVAFLGSELNCDGLLAYFVYASVFCCALTIRDDKLKLWVFRVFIIVIDVLAALMLLESFGVHPFDKIFQSDRASVFIQFNHFGYMLCMGGVAAAAMAAFDESVKFKVAHLVSFILIVVTLVVNDTFGCYLGLGVGLLALIALWFASGRKASVWPFSAVLLLVGLSAVTVVGAVTVTGQDIGSNFTKLAQDLTNIFSGSDSAMSAGTGRMRLWVEAMKLVPDRPIFGYGPEGLMGAYQHITGDIRPHNEFVQYLVFLGIPGFIFYVAALITLLVAQCRRLKSLTPMTLVAAAVVVGYLASSFAGNTMYGTAPYFWMALGFAAWVPGDEDALFAKRDRAAAAASAGEAAAPKVPRGAKIAIAAVLVVALGVGLWFALDRGFEATRETNDLKAQENAELVIKSAVENDYITESGTFWFDAQEMSIYPSGAAAPAPYGQGTEADGRATSSSTVYVENAYGYDTKADYRGKALQVDVQYNPDTKEVTKTMTWVATS